MFDTAALWLQWQVAVGKESRCVSVRLSEDELTSWMGMTDTPALCARTTPRPRRTVHQAELARSCYIRALRSVYKPCENGDFREECIIILHLNWT